MNSILLLIIGLPVLEILLMIEVGHNIGGINTVLLILLTAIIGIYFVRMQGLHTLKSGILNIYQKKSPINEIISGASIAVAAFLLIFPGFISDFVGFILLIPMTRNFLIKILLKNKIGKKNNRQNNEEIIEAEIIEDKKDEL